MSFMNLFFSGRDSCAISCSSVPLSVSLLAIRVGHCHLHACREGDRGLREMSIQELLVGGSLLPHCHQSLWSFFFLRKSKKEIEIH